MSWDILNLKEEDGWEHKQILSRLWDENIECLFADIWFDNNMALLVGCFYTNIRHLANVLGIHEDVIYASPEQGFIILNLFQEKCIRKKYE